MAACSRGLKLYCFDVVESKNLSMQSWKLKKSKKFWLPSRPARIFKILIRFTTLYWSIFVCSRYQKRPIFNPPPVHGHKKIRTKFSVKFVIQIYCWLWTRGLIFCVGTKALHSTFATPPPLYYGFTAQIGIALVIIMFIVCNL